MTHCPTCEPRIQSVNQGFLVYQPRTTLRLYKARVLQGCDYDDADIYLDDLHADYTLKELVFAGETAKDMSVLKGLVRVLLQGAYHILYTGTVY